MDLVGPLPTSAGFRYLLTCVDRFSRWPIAVPIADMQASTVVQVFIDQWIASFGVPATLTTDRGAQFESRLFSEFCRRFGIRRLRTTAYHPAANGMVERFHRQLKSALRSQPNSADWSENLALVLLGIRSSLKPDLGASAAELVYGAPLRLPGEFFSSADSTVPDPSSFLSRLRQFSQSLRPIEPRPPPSSHVFYVPAALDDCTHVYVRVGSVRQPLATPYDGPFRVIRRTDRVFELDVNGSPRTVSIDRLKQPIWTPSMTRLSLLSLLRIGQVMTFLLPLPLALLDTFTSHSFFCVSVLSLFCFMHCNCLQNTPFFFLLALSFSHELHIHLHTPLLHLTSFSFFQLVFFLFLKRGVL